MSAIRWRSYSVSSSSNSSGNSCLSARSTRRMITVPGHPASRVHSAVLHGSELACCVVVLQKRAVRVLERCIRPMGVRVQQRTAVRLRERFERTSPRSDVRRCPRSRRAQRSPPGRAVLYAGRSPSPSEKRLRLGRPGVRSVPRTSRHSRTLVRQSVEELIIYTSVYPDRSFAVTLRLPYRSIRQAVVRIVLMPGVRRETGVPTERADAFVHLLDIRPVPVRDESESWDRE